LAYSHSIRFQQDGRHQVKFQVVMTVEIPDEDTILDEYATAAVNHPEVVVREFIARTIRHPERFTVVEATKAV